MVLQVVWVQMSVSGIPNHCITVNRPRDQHNRNLQQVRDITPKTVGDHRVGQKDKIMILTASATILNYSTFIEYLLCTCHFARCRATR